MTAHTPPPDQDTARAADAVILALADELDGRLDELSTAMRERQAEDISELRDEPALDGMLAASNLGNLRAFVAFARSGACPDSLAAPPPAVEYARALARRGIAPSVLTRAYRLAQQRVLDWILVWITRHESDPRVAFAAGHRAMDLTFVYVDAVVERVVAEHQAERDLRSADRGTERADALRSLLSGRCPDPAAAERLLGHRLAQHHLGVVAWSAAPPPADDLPRRIEALLSSVADLTGTSRTPLLAAQEHGAAWAWIPLGPHPRTPDPAKARELTRSSGPDLRLALGTPAPGADGFRTTHQDALRARSVAVLAAERAEPVTAFTDPEVRVAALLAADLDATRRFVAASLGALAEDTAAAGRLRDTLLAFLDEKGSYVATADRVHLHRNSVKYRVDKAVEARGRPLTEDRLELELALVATRRLGAAVLPAPAP